MKRKIALVLAGIVAATAISGCGNKKGGKNAAEVSYNGDDIYPVSCEDTLTYWVPLNAVLSTTVSNFGESEIGKQLTADTGINVKYIHPTAGGEADQFSVLLASGDLPDIINWDWRAYGADKAMDNNFIIKLNDVIDKYAPNLKKLIDSDPDLEKMLKTDNGSYYAFPFLRGDEELCTYSGPIIRKDWLDKLGMDVPETVDEWETMLKRFKNELNVATPLTCTPADFKNGFFSGAFDAPYSFYIDDNGKAKYGPIEPGFKDFLVTMNKWYDEGLLDKNVATVTDTGALILNESAGATFGFVGGGIGTFLENMQKTNPKFDVVGAPYPVLNKGDRPMIGQKENRYGSAPSSAITTSCKNVELAARFLDYGFTEKGDMLFNFGIEGESYEMKDGKLQFTDKITKDPEGRTIDAMIAQYSLVGSSGIFSQRLDAVNLTRPFEQQQKAVEVWSNTDADKHSIPNIIFTQDESSSMGNSMSEIDTYVSSMVMKFITGVESIDKYDEFVAQIKTFNIDKVLEAYQAAIDRYNNR